MRKMLLTVAALVFVASSVFAQSTDPSQYDPQTWFAPACPTCVVLGYVDTPATSVTISRTDLYAGNVQPQGWGFQLNSGAPVNRIDVYVETADSTWVSVPQAPYAFASASLFRPDVLAAYAAYSPNLTAWTGWSLHITNWPDWALGAHRVTFVLWQGPYHANIVRTYNITQ